jgi:formylmethanofuran dehydrogenase subunit E
MSPLEKAIQFHGHICPELLMGIRAAEFALSYLQVEPGQEELSTIAENSSCGLDAFQAILGCTVGKGNLYWRDYGKMVYTVFCQSNNRAIRLAQRMDALDNPVVEKYLGLRGQEKLTPEEEAEQEMLLAEMFEWIMGQPLEKLFNWREVDRPEIDKAAVQESVACQKCGEGVMENRAVLTEDGLLCPECRLLLGGNK